jgi:hypothetical protein
MNLGVMRTEVRDIIGEETADFWTDAELNRYLNEAQHRFLQEERWPWLVSEATGSVDNADGELTLTEGVAFNRQLNITLTKDGDTRSYQPKRVTPVEGFRLKSQYSTSTTTSYPSWFYVTSAADDDDDGGYIYVVKLVPSPTTDMDVDYQYIRATVSMDADNAVADLPLEYHKALVHYAAGTAWLKELNGEQKASEQFGMYGSIVTQARDEWLTESADNPVVMGGEAIDSYVGRGIAYPYIPETLGP